MRSQDTTQAIQGRALVPTPFLSVQWIWPTLPIALSCGSLILLVSTIIVTRKRGLRPWKSSCLALLPALDVETKRSLGPMDHIGAMEKWADRLHVQLSLDDYSEKKAWRLTGRSTTSAPPSFAR